MDGHTGGVPGAPGAARPLTISPLPNHCGTPPVKTVRGWTWLSWSMCSLGSPGFHSHPCKTKTSKEAEIKSCSIAKPTANRQHRASENNKIKQNPRTWEVGEGRSPVVFPGPPALGGCVSGGWSLTFSVPSPLKPDSRLSQARPQILGLCLTPLNRRSLSVPFQAPGRWQCI